MIPKCEYINEDINVDWERVTKNKDNYHQIKFLRKFHELKIRQLLLKKVISGTGICNLRLIDKGRVKIKGKYIYVINISFFIMPLYILEMAYKNEYRKEVIEDLMDCWKDPKLDSYYVFKKLLCYESERKFEVA